MKIEFCNSSQLSINM